MEHRLITGGEQFLPFARSRIKALRATGLKYASQQFEIDGCTVKVRIEPNHEYITLSGGGTLDYLVWPTSDEHPLGITTVLDPTGVTVGVSPNALMSASNGGGKPALHTETLSLQDDWVSFDGVAPGGKIKYGRHLITFHTGSLFRYQFANPANIYEHSPAAYMNVDGVQVRTSRGVRGAALRTDQTVIEGGAPSPVENTIFVAHTNYASIDLIRFHSTEGVGDARLAIETQFASFTPGGGLRITHPVFFDGVGKKFASVVETYSATGYTSPRFTLQGEVLVSASGEWTATFSMEPITLIDGSMPESSSVTFTGVPDDGYRTSSGGTTIAISNTTSLIGVDMSIDGKLLVVLRRETSTTTTTGSVIVSRTSYGGMPGTEEISSSGTQDFVSTVGITVNGIFIASGITTGRSQSSFSSSNVFSPPPTSSTRHSDSTASSEELAYLCLRDIDARHNASVFVKATSGHSAYSLSDAVDGSGNELHHTWSPWTISVIAAFGAWSQSKTIAVSPRGDGPGIPFPGNECYCRMFASRRHDEFVMCASLIGGAKGQDDPYKGIVDQSPISCIMKNGVVGPITSAKFGLGAAAGGFSVYPINLVNSARPKATTL